MCTGLVLLIFSLVELFVYFVIFIYFYFVDLFIYIFGLVVLSIRPIAQGWFNGPGAPMRPGVGVTKAPFVNSSLSKIFVLAKNTQALKPPQHRLWYFLWWRHARNTVLNLVDRKCTSACSLNPWLLKLLASLQKLTRMSSCEKNIVNKILRVTPTTHVTPLHLNMRGTSCTVLTK